MIEVEEQARDVRGVARRLRENLLQPLVQERAIGQPRQYVVLRELVRMGRRDFEFLGPLRNLVFQRALVARDLGLRFGQALRHVIEGVREEAKLVGRACRHVHIELAGAHRAGGAHQPPHRRNEPPGQEQRHADRNHDDQGDDRECADQRLPELHLLPLERHADANEADRNACDR